MTTTASIKPASEWSGGRAPSSLRCDLAAHMAFLWRQAGVLCLLLASYPAHVTGLVVSVVINAVQRQGLVFGDAHVFDKGCEAIAPAVADAYSSASVVAERQVLRVVTTLPECAPYPVLARLASSVCALASLASTRRGRADAQIPYEYFALHPADASTQQVARRTPKACRRFGDDGPVTNHGTDWDGA